MFVSYSEIEVVPDQVGALVRAFRRRARLVDQHPGFLGLELLRDVGRRGRFVLITRWTDQASFRSYMKSGDYREAHERQHEGIAHPAMGGPLRQFESVRLDPPADDDQSVVASLAMEAE